MLLNQSFLPTFDSKMGVSRQTDVMAHKRENQLEIVKY
jgi:hypothetical protein